MARIGEKRYEAKGRELIKTTKHEHIIPWTMDIVKTTPNPTFKFLMVFVLAVIIAKT